MIYTKKKKMTIGFEKQKRKPTIISTVSVLILITDLHSANTKRVLLKQSQKQNSTTKVYEIGIIFVIMKYVTPYYKKFAFRKIIKERIQGNTQSETKVITSLIPLVHCSL